MTARTVSLTAGETARFWSKVSKTTAEQCWLWVGAEFNNKGYGRFTTWPKGGGRIRHLSHRTAYELTNGAIPEGLVVRHECDTPACCNPAHMKIGTQLQNIRDMHERGRENLSGLEKGRQARREVNADRAERVARLLDAGCTASEVAGSIGIPHRSLLAWLRAHERRDLVQRLSLRPEISGKYLGYRGHREGAEKVA